MINVGSGLGFREPVMDRMRDLLFAGSLVSSALLLWMHLRAPWWTWAWPLWSYAVLCVVSGTVIWPLNSLLIVRRRRPAGIDGSSVTLDLARPDGHRRLDRNRPGFLAAAAAAQRVVSVAAPRVGPGDPRICPSRSMACGSCRSAISTLLPASSAGFSKRVIEACLGWQADLVVMTGDLVEDDETIALGRAAPEPAGGPAGQVRDPGQSRRRASAADIAGELDRAGFEMLEGRWTTLDLEGTTLAIGGTSAPWGPAFAAERHAAGRLPHPAEPFARPLLQGPAVGNRPDALGPQPRRPDPASRSSARSSCPAATRAGSTAGSSARTGR